MFLSLTISDVDGSVTAVHLELADPGGAPPKWVGHFVAGTLGARLGLELEPGATIADAVAEMLAVRADVRAIVANAAAAA